MTFLIDGIHGSAVAGLHKCLSQARVNTPKPVWNPDQPQTMNFYEDWEEVPNTPILENGSRCSGKGSCAMSQRTAPEPTIRRRREGHAAG
ncbi:MAG: hypothetical protein ACU0DW_10640 [Shimia sp.]